MLISSKPRFVSWGAISWLMHARLLAPCLCVPRYGSGLDVADGSGLDVAEWHGSGLDVADGKTQSF